MVEFYLLTFPRFPLRKKEHKSYFGKNRTHDFRTSRCASYLLDHSGDEYEESNTAKTHSPRVSPYCIRVDGTNIVYCLVFVWCPCMAINVNVQYYTKLLFSFCLVSLHGD